MAAIRIPVTCDVKDVDTALTRLQRKFKSLTGQHLGGDAGAIKAEIDAYEQEIAKLKEKIALEKQAMGLSRRNQATAERRAESERQAYERASANRKHRLSPEDAAGFRQRIKAAYAEADVAISEQDVAQGNITAAQTRVTELTAKVQQLKTELKSMGKETGGAMSAVSTGVTQITNHMSRLAKRMFIWALFSRALMAVRNEMSRLLKSDEKVAKSLNQIKSALQMSLAAAFTAALPAIQALLNWLAQLTAAIAKVLGALFGTSAAAQDTASSLSAAGGAGGGAAKQLMKFDEINQMTGGGGGGGGGGGKFELAEVSEHMENVAKWVLSIGAALVGWKFAQKLGFLAGGSGISNVLTNLGQIAGLAYGIKESIDLYETIKGAIENGITTETVVEGIDNLTGALAGFMAAAGKFKAAGVLLVIQGLTKLLNWMNAHVPELAEVAGSIVVGASDIISGAADWGKQAAADIGGFAKKAGSNLLRLGITSLAVPIPGVGGLIQAIEGLMPSASAEGAAYEPDQGNPLHAFSPKEQKEVAEFPEQVYGNWEDAISGITDSAQKGTDTLKTTTAAAADGMQKSLTSAMAKAGSKIKSTSAETASVAKKNIGGIGDALKGTTQGIGSLASDLSSALSNIELETFSTLDMSLEDALKAAINAAFKSLAQSINSALAALKKDINTAIGGIKGAVGGVIGGATISAGLNRTYSVKAPELASGAVIPANNRFLAVLGDQTQGTNIEAPLSTIVDAMMTALGATQGGGSAQAIRAALNGMAIKVDKRTIGYVVADSINANRRADGKLALNL